MKNHRGRFQLKLKWKVSMPTPVGHAEPDTWTCRAVGESEFGITSQGWANKKCFWQETEAIGLQQPRIGLRPQLQIKVQDARNDFDSSPLVYLYENL